MDNSDDRRNLASRERGRSKVNQLVQQGGNNRSKSPAVQVVGERRRNPSASEASTSKVRERSQNRPRRNVPDDQSTSSVEVCYDSRLVEPPPVQGQEFRHPSSREKPRDQRERTGSGQADRRASGKKMRHKTAKRGSSNVVDD